MKSSMLSRLTLLFVLLFASTASAQNAVCNNAVLLQSVAVSISSATTTRVVLNTDTEKATYICGINVTMVGAATAQTVLVQYGTGATCGTGTTNLTGAFTASTVVGSSTVISTPPGSFKATPVANSTCLATTTGDAVRGVISFVVQ